MRLIVIGEYAAKIPEDVQRQNLEIEWNTIKAARNFYVHVYLSVGWEKVWDTIHSNLLPLREKLVEMKLNEN